MTERDDEIRKQVQDRVAQEAGTAPPEEDSELTSELLPPDDGPRNRMLFTEAAEGGAGVLRLMQSAHSALARAAAEALA